MIVPEDPTVPTADWVEKYTVGAETQTVLNLLDGDGGDHRDVRALGAVIHTVPEPGDDRGAVAALVHDVLITMGVFSVTSLEFNLSIVAALLTIVGYSLNDTIVLFDRIRENFPRLRNSKPVEVVNTSVNQTLSRTLMTSLTTLLVLIALFSFGGEIINAFAFTLIVGVVVGTYSSIYVASTTLLELGVSKFDLLQVEKEGAAVDDRP